MNNTTMKNNVFETIIVNRHLLINDGRGNMLIDTGSPASFHNENHIFIDTDDYEVQTSYMGTTTQYFSDKVGCEIVGLIGMDIISQYTMWIDIPMTKPFVAFYKDDNMGSRYPIDSFSVMGIPGFCMEINGRKARLLFDTGAHISYIHSRFYDNEPMLRTCTDFSPLLNAEYEVEMYGLSTRFCEKILSIEFGSMPQELSTQMNHLNVDGIIGYDLMEDFRIVIDRGIFKIPPQGI